MAEALCLNKEGALFPFRFKQVIMKPKLKPTQTVFLQRPKHAEVGKKFTAQLLFQLERVV